MPLLLFRLNGVPEDEAQAMRELLDEHHIDYYETSAGRWGISMAGLWLRDESEQFEQAKALLDEYQRQHTVQAQQAYAELEAKGEAETLLGRIMREPLRFLIYLLAILLVLYFSILPFVHLAGGK